MTSRPRTQCGTCQRLRSPYSEHTPAGVDGPWCEAFPDGIPEPVFTNATDHRDPVDGDHGLQWLARPGMTYPLPLFDEAARIAAAEPEPTPEARLDGMLALVPDEASLTALHTSGLNLLDQDAERVGDLHLTLAYVPDAAGETGDAMRTAGQTLAAAIEPFDARIFAFGLFNPAGDEPCIVALLSGDPLTSVHTAATAALDSQNVDRRGEHQPWHAHLTLAYTPDHYRVVDLADSDLPDLEIRFDRLRVAAGDSVEDYPLGATLPEDEPPSEEVDVQPDCPPGQHRMPDGTCMDDAEMMSTDGEEFHLPGKHNQKDHASRAKAGSSRALPPGAKPHAPHSSVGRDYYRRVSPENPSGVPEDGQSTVTFAVGEAAEDAAAAGRQEPLGETQPDEYSSTAWYAVAVVEGEWSNGQQLAPGALDWAGMLPEPLLWQPVSAPGHDGSVVVGRVDGAMRSGPLVWTWGVFDDAGRDGAEALRLVSGGFLKGVSIKADDIEPQDVELVCPAAAVDDALGMPDGMCEAPKNLIHRGRLRSLTLVAEPNFPGAELYLGEPPPELGLVMVAAAVRSHNTGTSDEAWDGPANEKRLPSPMPVGKGRAAYAWVDETQVDAGQMPKTAGRFIHHNVSEDGTPGAANLTACSTGIGVLNGGRGGTTIPAADTQGVYDHLAAHLRDGDREPPALTGAAHVVTAAGYTITIPDLPPEEWFDPPTSEAPIGAVHVTDQGRVFGRLAPAGVTHRAFRASGQDVTAPRHVDYSEFANKPVLVAGSDGQPARINAGNITMNCGHISPYDPRRADPNAALEHYDNSCSVVARVRVGEDPAGTWVAGALLHDVSPDMVERMMACALSGDWQGGKLKAALLVPVEGLPTPVAGNVRIVAGAVVASSSPVRFVGHPPQPAAERRLLERLAATVGRDTRSRMSALRARVHPEDRSP